MGLNPVSLNPKPQSIRSRNREKWLGAADRCQGRWFPQPQEFHLHQSEPLRQFPLFPDLRFAPSTSGLAARSSVFQGIVVRVFFQGFHFAYEFFFGGKSEIELLQRNPHLLIFWLKNLLWRNVGALGCTQSLLPLHSAVAAARLTAHISTETRAFCELSQGTSLRPS